MDHKEQWRREEAWRQANKKDIIRRVRLFMAAYSAICNEYGLRVSDAHDNLPLEDITQDKLGPIPIVDAYGHSPYIQEATS